MANLTFTQLVAQANTTLEDNTSGSITPADVRTMILNMLGTMQPYYAAMNIGTTPVAFSATTTYVTLPYESIYTVTTPAWSASITGTATRLDAATTRVTFTTDVTLAANRVVDYALFKDGVITTWVQSQQGTGAGVPISISFSAITTSATPNTVYTVRVKTDAATALTHYNTTFVLENVPLIGS